MRMTVPTGSPVRSPGVKRMERKAWTAERVTREGRSVDSTSTSETLPRSLIHSRSTRRPEATMGFVSGGSSSAGGPTGCVRFVSWSVV